MRSLKLVAMTISITSALNVVPKSFIRHSFQRPMQLCMLPIQAGSNIREHQETGTKLCRRQFSSTTALNAKPKRGSVVDTYQTVSVNCAKCNQRLFRYKKKNGTKSNLIKCFVERIAEDSCGVLRSQRDSGKSMEEYTDWACPNCETKFARSATIKGLPALKLVGGKVRMTKK
mmetsp:Transcript_26209/g.63873  ORF Transcript_26209/g.63873 Transcript_26209/m.63873 type:complete len:173 (-) Transcript_26209:1192-1710(-)